MSAQPKPAAPTPGEVEALAEEYRELEQKIDAIEKKAVDDAAAHKLRRDELWDLMLAQVRDFGSAHAEKSKILYGLELEVMGTFSSGQAIDAAAVETFRLALVKAGRTRFLKKVFERSERWTPLPEASALIRKEHETGSLPWKLFAMFSSCTVSKELTPKLVVRPRTKVA